MGVSRVAVVTVEQEETQTILLHGGLVAGGRRTVLELGVHHGCNVEGFVRNVGVRGKPRCISMHTLIIIKKNTIKIVNHTAINIVILGINGGNCTP